MTIELWSLEIADIKVVRTRKIADDRGFFSETYSEKDFAAAGIAVRFVQDNHFKSSRAGTIRGLHFQREPFAQDKLVRVLRGRAFDVAVDLRKSSRTFGKWVGIELSSDDWKQVFIPKGFAHGVCALEPDTAVAYKVSNPHAQEHDLGVVWNDPDLAIDWPIGRNDAILSERDRTLPRLRDIADLFD
jgi:dTDP-4-dehydrorhamnose 3,5-epimerase